MSDRNANHLVVQFTDPLTIDIARDLEDALRAVAQRRDLVIEDMYAAYDDGFGHITQTELADD